jgi:hypothetical protein
MKALVLNQQVRLVAGGQDDKDRYDAGLVLIKEGLAIARYDSRDGYGTHPREASYIAADSASPNCTNTSTAPPTTPPPGGTGCDPSYPGVCIAPAPPDLDCGDIPHSGFTVLEPDPHGFDGDNDGVGCE